jgi:hypothetical protein
MISQFNNNKNKIRKFLMSNNKLNNRTNFRYLKTSSKYNKCKINSKNSKREKDNFQDPRVTM